MVISTYLSIITWNVNGLNALIKRQSGRLDTKTRTYTMLPTRDPIYSKRNINIESKGMEKDISNKWKLKESRVSNTHIRQNRL